MHKGTNSIKGLTIKSIVKQAINCWRVNFTNGDFKAPISMSDEVDVFWGRCAVKTAEEIAASPFVYDHKLSQPHWEPDGTCSHCGGMRPSIALKAIREGALVEPTDKNYKIYVKGVNLPGCPANKCYLNHFSEAQAVEFVLLAHTGKMKLATPGHFYSGLCFGVYKAAIEKALHESIAQASPGGEPVDP